MGSVTAQAYKPAKTTLVDIPVSNNGARVRFLIYKLGLEGEVDIQTPKVLGGLKSPEFLALHPAGKVPMIVESDGSAILESEVCALYLLEKYADKAKGWIPDTPLLRAKARLVARWIDVYLTPIQGCMYMPMEAGQRAAEIEQLAKNLDALEQIIEGPFALGSQMCHADAAVFPTLVFMEFILPKHFGWQDVYQNRPKLKAYREAIQQDPAGAKVCGELLEALQAWEDGKRWDDLGITAQLKSHPDYKWACS